jgi:hypothetical protein
VLHPARVPNSLVLLIRGIRTFVRCDWSLVVGRSHGVSCCPNPANTCQRDRLAIFNRGVHVPVSSGSSRHDPPGLPDLLFRAALLSGLYNLHRPGEASATGLSLIYAFVTVYVEIGGLVLG